MYIPPKFQVSEDDGWGIVADAGAATLVRLTDQGLQSAFAPALVSDDRMALLTHVARANPWWRGLADGSEVLAIFVAASAYVSPLHYPSRLENPDVVPTWNYAMAQVRGTALVRDDESWKLEQVRRLTENFERGNDPPWSVDDMAESYRSSQLKAIVGLEIRVVSIEAKAKLSQNRPEEDRRSVQSHFVEGTPTQRIVGTRMTGTG